MSSSRRRRDLEQNDDDNLDAVLDSALTIKNKVLENLLIQFYKLTLFKRI
jgi:hypothetical protein